jgi:hypothetical protein
LPATSLVLEITESVMMARAAESIDLLRELRSLGIHISIDDFGTGYSSLAYLKHLPADILKIDRSFIQDIPDDEDAIAIVKGITALAHSLRMKVVAEGVETVAQQETMALLNCAGLPVLQTATGGIDRDPVALVEAAQTRRQKSGLNPPCPILRQARNSLHAQRLGRSVQSLSTDLPDKNGDNHRLERRKAMALPGPGTGGVAGIEFAAGRGANVVDRAGNRIADRPGERHAARCGGIGAAQANDGRRHRHGHFRGNARAPGKGAAGQLHRMKIDAETGAAGAAGLADVHGKVTRQRHNR